MYTISKSSKEHYLEMLTPCLTVTPNNITLLTCISSSGVLISKSMLFKSVTACRLVEYVVIFNTQLLKLPFAYCFNGGLVMLYSTICGINVQTITHSLTGTSYFSVPCLVLKSNIKHVNRNRRKYLSFSLTALNLLCMLTFFPESSLFCFSCFNRAIVSLLFTETIDGL